MVFQAGGMIPKQKALGEKSSVSSEQGDGKKY